MVNTLEVICAHHMDDKQQPNWHLKKGFDMLFQKFLTHLLLGIRHLQHDFKSFKSYKWGWVGWYF